MLRNPTLRLLRSGSFRYPAKILKTFTLPGWIVIGFCVGLGAIPLLAMKRWALGMAGLAAVLAWSVEAKSRRAEPRSRAIAEICNVIAASLLAPAATYASTGSLGWRELTLFTLCAVFFSLTTVDVRWRVAKLHQEGTGRLVTEEIRRLGWQKMRLSLLFVVVGGILVRFNF